MKQDEAYFNETVWINTPPGDKDILEQGLTAKQEVKVRPGQVGIAYTLAAWGRLIKLLRRKPAR
jgi:hypothetical protein